jgi:hypothetical protein
MGDSFGYVNKDKCCYQPVHVPPKVSPEKTSPLTGAYATPIYSPASQQPPLPRSGLVQVN